MEEATATLLLETLLETFTCTLAEQREESRVRLLLLSLPQAAKVCLNQCAHLDQGERGRLRHSFVCLRNKPHTAAGKNWTTCIKKINKKNQGSSFNTRTQRNTAAAFLRQKLKIK